MTEPKMSATKAGAIGAAVIFALQVLAIGTIEFSERGLPPRAFLFVALGFVIPYGIVKFREWNYYRSRR